jgi:hypothetical protein
MWRKLPEDAIQQRAKDIEKKPRIPRLIQSAIATVIFVTVLYGISYLNGVLQGDKIKPGQSFNLQNASALSLLAVFVATIGFMYFLLVKNRKRPVIFICYDCEEPFHAQPTCPACGSANVSDIRFAEWIEEELR